MDKTNNRKYHLHNTICSQSRIHKLACIFGVSLLCTSMPDVFSAPKKQPINNRIKNKSSIAASTPDSTKKSNSTITTDIRKKESPKQEIEQYSTTEDENHIILDATEQDSTTEDENPRVLDATEQYSTTEEEDLKINNNQNDNNISSKPTQSPEIIGVDQMPQTFDKHDNTIEDETPQNNIKNVNEVTMITLPNDIIDIDEFKQQLDSEKFEHHTDQRQLSQKLQQEDIITKNKDKQQIKTLQPIQTIKMNNEFTQNIYKPKIYNPTQNILDYIKTLLKIDISTEYLFLNAFNNTNDPEVTLHVIAQLQTYNHYTNKSRLTFIMAALTWAANYLQKQQNTTQQITPENLLTLALIHYIAEDFISDTHFNYDNNEIQRYIHKLKQNNSEIYQLAQKLFNNDQKHNIATILHRTKSICSILMFKYDEINNANSKIKELTMQNTNNNEHFHLPVINNNTKTQDIQPHVTDQESIEQQTQASWNALKTQLQNNTRSELLLDHFKAINNPTVIIDVLGKIIETYSNNETLFKECFLAASLWVDEYLKTTQYITPKTLLTLAIINNMIKFNINYDSSDERYQPQIIKHNRNFAIKATQLLIHCNNKTELEFFYDIYEICYNIAAKYNDLTAFNEINLPLDIAKKSNDLLTINQFKQPSKTTQQDDFAAIHRLKPQNTIELSPLD